VQRACSEVVAAAADVAEADVPTAIDGCGVVTYALPLERMALVFARLEQVEGGPQVAAAMRAHPELIRGPGAPDTELMRRHAGWTAKGGAEGILCAAGPAGLGLALKVADGGGRAVGPALAELLRRLGHEAPELAAAELVNSRGERVGELVVEN
jgi:L-asparaginase II